MAESTPQISGSDAVLYLSSSSITTVPVQTVWQTLLDTSTWPSWNTFCPRVTIRHQPTDPATSPSGTATDTPSPVLQNGTQVTFHVRMDPSSSRETDAHLIVTQCEPPEANRPVGRIAWAADFSASGTIPRMLLMAERVHEIAEVGVGEEKRTEVRNWEVQTGYLAYVVRCMYGKFLQGVFEGWVKELKEFVEA